MRTLAAVTLAAICAALLSTTSAEAFPGSMCFNATGCQRCEVCVKAQPLDVSGTCLKIAGCY